MITMRDYVDGKAALTNSMHPKQTGWMYEFLMKNLPQTKEKKKE